MEIKDRREVVAAIDKIATSASTREGPEGSYGFARSYSLYIRDARKKVSEKVLRETLKAIAIQKGDDAGMSPEKTLEFWEDTDENNH